MSVLIVYGTKYGFTEKCAKILADKLSEKAQLVNIQKTLITDLSGYDKVIIGASIYMGRPQKKVKEFCQNNINVLLNKKVGVFICCSMSGEGALKELKDAFPNELYNSAVVKDYFGGEVNLDKAKFFDKLIIKMVSKADKDSEVKRNNGICMDNINRFADKINNC